MSERDLAASIRKRAGDLKSAGDYAGALKLRLYLEQLFVQIGSPTNEQAMNLNSIAYLGVQSGALDEAERAARRCLEVYERVDEAKDEALATYLMMLASVLAERQKFDEAVTYAERAIAIFARNQGEHESFVLRRQKDLDDMRRRTSRFYLERRP